MPDRSRVPRLRLWWLWPVAVLVVLGLQLWFPEAGSGVRHDTYSVSAEGQRAFHDLVLGEAGWTTRNQQPLPRVLSQGLVEPTLCLLGPHRWPTEREWDAILNWVAEGNRLVFSFRGFEERTIPRLEIRYTPRTGFLPPDDSLPPETGLVASKNVAWWTDGRLLAPGSRVLVSYNDTPQVVTGEWGAGTYVVSASSLIFSNQLLTYGDNPVLALKLLEHDWSLDGVTFDESLNATATPKVVGLLFDRELRPLTMQLILLTLLYAWWNGQRFGPWESARSGGRHDIVDHTDALGVMHWRARNGAGVLRAVWRLFQREQGLHQPRTGRLETLASRAGVEPTDLRDRLQEAERLAARETVERHDAARIIRELHELRRKARR